MKKIKTKVVIYDCKRKKFEEVEKEIALPIIETQTGIKRIIGDKEAILIAARLVLQISKSVIFVPISVGSNIIEFDCEVSIQKFEVSSDCKWNAYKNNSLVASGSAKRQEIVALDKSITKLEVDSGTIEKIWLGVFSAAAVEESLVSALEDFIKLQEVESKKPTS